MDTTKTLQELQNELKNLRPAVEVVDKATGFAILANQKFEAIDKLATEALKKVQTDLEATTVKVVERVDGCATTCESAVEATAGAASGAINQTARTAQGAISDIHEQASGTLQTIEGKHLAHLEQTRTELDEFVKKAEENLNETLKNLKEVVETEIVEYRHLVEAAGAIIKKIDDINFPERLDKIDNNISAINLGIQNLQNRLGDLSRDVSDGFKESHKKMDGLAEKMSNEFSEVKGQAEFYGAQQSQHAFWIKMMIGINLSLGLGMLLAILTR